MKLGRVIVCMAITVIGVAGCGGSSSSTSSSTTASISKDDFVTQANQICAAGDKTINTAAHQTFSGGKPSATEAQKFVTDSLVPSVQSQVDDIRALGIPAGDEDQVNAFLDAADKAVAAVTADPTLALSNGPGPFTEVNKLANAYGLTECGS